MTADLRSRVQESLGGAYTLERELGGGMSRVFLASEARLKRKVVVKVLAPELAAGVSADRFEREIMFAAQLSHPSIVPVLTAGEADGLPYYTMPFVEGKSLRARLGEEGALPISTVVGILRDVARALAYSHERSVVHRDIKPDNVLLAGDVAVVTDFGIAKAISAALTDSGSTTLTSVGTMVGTPAYMAPEQASADPAIDFRADIYSFGCLAYELLAGEPPFSARLTHEMLAAHLAEAPADLQSKCLDCPPALAALVMRCLEKNPAQRPQSAREIVRVLDTLLAPSAQGSSERRLSSRRIGLAALILAAAALGAYLFQQRSDSSSSAGPAFRSIAVVPFVNTSGDTADAYFADGMSEELATALSKVQGLRVVARTSPGALVGSDVDPQEIGRTLAVDAVLAGSVRRARDQMRLTVQLTRTSDGSLLWSEQYQKQVSDVFAVQNEMASAIRRALQLQFAPTPAASASSPNDSSRGTSNLEAYDLYLRGQFNLRRRGSGISAAAENFRAAIAKDSGFARAYSGLSAALELFPYFMGVPPHTIFDEVMAVAQRALALDSSLAEAHTSMALAYQHAFQWQRAEEEYRRGIAVDPNDAAAHFHYARFLTYVGRPREALVEVERAKALEPYSAVIAGWVATALRFTGDVDAAVIEARRAIELDSTNSGGLAQAAYSLLAAGHNEEARQAAAGISPSLPFIWPGIIASLDALAGHPAAAMQLVRQIDAMRSPRWGTETTIALALLGLGDSTRALDALERALDAREMWPSSIPVLDLPYDLVRRTPRFAELLRRVGLDPALFTNARSSRSPERRR